MLPEPEYTEFHKKVHHLVHYQAIVKLLSDCYVILCAASLTLKVFPVLFPSSPRIQITLLLLVLENIF